MFAPIHREKKIVEKLEVAKIQSNMFVWRTKVKIQESLKNVTLDWYEKNILDELEKAFKKAWRAFRLILGQPLAVPKKFEINPCNGF